MCKNEDLIDNDPVIIRTSQLITASKIAKSPGSFIDNLKNNNPLFVIKEGEVKAVLITINDYRSLLNNVIISD